MAIDWDGVGGGNKSPASFAKRSLFVDLKAALTLGNKKSMNRAIEKINGAFEKTPFNHWYNYDFVITAGRRLAWVPPGTKKGEALCFFEGADVPFVLRPVEGGQFELVGEGCIQRVFR
jgi:hypothetical protein